MSVAAIELKIKLISGKLSTHNQNQWKTVHSAESKQEKAKTKKWIKSKKEFDKLIMRVMNAVLSERVIEKGKKQLSC